MGSKEQREYYNSYRWQKLGVAAAWYEYDWGEEQAHDSLADCRATLHVWQKMLTSGDKERAEQRISALYGN